MSTLWRRASRNTSGATRTPSTTWRISALASSTLLPLAKASGDYVDPGYQWAIEAVVGARRAIEALAARKPSAPTESQTIDELAGHRSFGSGE